jgi:hypothetical protein
VVGSVTSRGTEIRGHLASLGLHSQECEDIRAYSSFLLEVMLVSVELQVAWTRSIF